MSSRPELVHLSGREGNLATVIHGWTAALETLAAGVVMDTSALAQVIGISKVVLEKLREKETFLSLRSLGPDEWLWTFRRASRDDPSLTEEYLRFLDAASAEAFTSQRPDLMGELTLPAHALFDQLPEGIRVELRSRGKAPEAIVAHDAAF